MSYTASVKKQEKGEVEFTGKVHAEAFEGYRSHAIEHLGGDLEVPGFRKGKAPETILMKHIPEMAILEEMANHAIMEAYPKMLGEHKINAIGQPAVQITKIAKGSDLEFTLRTAVMPELTLPDYKAISKKEGIEVKAEVTETEFEEAVKQVQQMHAQGINENKARQVEEKTTDEETPSSDVAKTEKVATDTEQKEETPLPELTDEYVQTLGAFKTVEEFKTKLRENLRLEKEHREHEKNRLTIMEKILEGTTGEIPNILIEGELDRMLYRMKMDISGMGLSYEDYLKHLNKSESVIRDEFRADAEKRVKMEILISDIATKENLQAPKEDMEQEVERLLKEYPGADKSRTEAYVEQILINEQVFKLLEGTK